MAFSRHNRFVRMSDLELEQAQGGGQTVELESDQNYIGTIHQLAQDVDGDMAFNEEEDTPGPPLPRLVAVPTLTSASEQPAYQDPFTPSRDSGYQYGNAYTPPGTQGSTCSGQLEFAARVVRPGARQWQQTLPMTPSSMSPARMQQDIFGDSLVTPAQTSSINSQNCNNPIHHTLSGYQPGIQEPAPLPWHQNVWYQTNPMPMPTGYWRVDATTITIRKWQAAEQRGSLKRGSDADKIERKCPAERFPRSLFSCSQSRRCQSQSQSQASQS
ncbi:Hypothetical predicted protein [Lecanosticta acicola]|uniref:Uncharacterized protein n=1 Tax=Lecanosticta acicola TaxID=111012 RepID=A0AAI8Z769_9PEZI|nr:Hypothetical predicted protein [Lecanosticta acicola]